MQVANGVQAMAQYGAVLEPDVEFPEILIYYYQLEWCNHQHLMWSGGLMDQPAQFMFEIAIIEAEMKSVQQMNSLATATPKNVLQL